MSLLLWLACWHRPPQDRIQNQITQPGNIVGIEQGLGCCMKSVCLCLAKLISVSFLIRNSGKEYHSQAGSTMFSKSHATGCTKSGHKYLILIRICRAFRKWTTWSPNFFWTDAPLECSPKSLTCFMGRCCL